MTSVFSNPNTILLHNDKLAGEIAIGSPIDQSEQVGQHGRKRLWVILHMKGEDTAVRGGWVRDDVRKISVEGEKRSTELLRRSNYGEIR